MACSWRSSGLSTLAIMHTTGLSPRDRSYDRNDQHQTARRRHPANVAYPRRAARSGTRMLLLIAGSPPSPTEDGNLGLWRVRAPRVPLLKVTRSQQRSLMSPVAGYPQVSSWLFKAMIAARPSKLAMRIRFPSSDYSVSFSA